MKLYLREQQAYDHKGISLGFTRDVVFRHSNNREVFSTVDRDAAEEIVKRVNAYEELLSDKERLDFVAKHCQRKCFGPYWLIEWQYGDSDSLRDVIDNARKEGA